MEQCKSFYCIKPPSRTAPHSYGHSTVIAPRFSLTFQPNYRNLTYVTVAKGYRMGGPNPYTSLCCDRAPAVPATYGPDSVWNFEVGSRSTLRDGRLQIDISLFHMVWYDIQAPAVDNQANSAYLNAGRAASD